MAGARSVAAVLCAVAVLAAPGTAAAASTAPAYAGDFPDPFVLRVGGTYFAYATQTGATSVQRMQSSDTVRWHHGLGNALPALPPWAQWGHTWAPSVLRRGLTYVLYYTARDRASGRQCISRAVSVLPQGPFVDASLSPWLCQLDRGGSIDPYAFVDDGGVPYLLWKSDDNALGRPTTLWGQRLSADGLSRVGTATPLLAADAAWEGGVVEGPAMTRAPGGQRYLFYGANAWDSPAAGIGFATCAGPLGPCAKATRAGPWMASSGQKVGPAGPTFFTDAGGGLRLGYHAWSPGRVGYPAGGARSLWIDRVDFVGGQPVAV